MKKAFILLSFLLSSFGICTKVMTAEQNLNSTEIQWQVRDLSTLSSYTEACVKEFNDQGQVLIVGRKQNQTYENPLVYSVLMKGKHKICTWSLWDPQFGLIPIDDSFDASTISYWQRINAEGKVIGLTKARGYNATTRTVDEFYYIVNTWQIGVGTKDYDIPFSNKHRKNSNLAFIANCRSSNSVVVTCMYSTKKGESYDSEVFCLQDEEMKDITPVLRSEAEILGFDAGDFLIISVNSKGNLLGRFDNYVNNPYKDVKSVVGTKYFLWDNIRMTIIDNPDELPCFVGRENFTDVDHTFLDANDQILFDVFVETLRYKQSWIWSEKNGLVKLNPEQCLGLAPGRGWAHAIGLLDNSTLVWTVNNYDEFNGFIFQNESHQIRLPLDKYRNPLPEHLGEYQGLKSKFAILNGTWPIQDKYFSSNSNGEFSANALYQMFFTGKVFGEEHPFYIEEVEKSL